MEKIKSVASAIPTSTDEAKERLSEAYAQIQKLKDQLAEQGLRQRKTDAGAGSAKSNAPLLQQRHPQSAAEGGVPVQIVAGLCLLSFLLAYFFF
jgi:type VI protein secretion system component VasF